MGRPSPSYNSCLSMTVELYHTLSSGQSITSPTFKFIRHDQSSSDTLLSYFTTSHEYLNTLRIADSSSPYHFIHKCRSVHLLMVPLDQSVIEVLWSYFNASTWSPSFSSWHQIIYSALNSISLVNLVSSCSTWEWNLKYYLSGSIMNLMVSKDFIYVGYYW